MTDENFASRWGRSLRILEFLSKYKRNLETRIDDIGSDLSGSVSDMEQYRAVVGEIGGLSFAVEEISRLCLENTTRKTMSSGLILLTT